MPKLFFGWWILAVAFVGEMFAIGSTTYAFGLFVKPLTAEFGIDRATANTGLMLFILGMGLSAPLLGRMLDRWPARIIVPAGAVLMGAGMGAIAYAPNLLVMALCIALPVAVGATASGPLAANTLGARWFERRRGMALGIVAVGTSAGGALIVPLMAFTMSRYGWRDALLIQGVLIALVVGTLAAWILRDRPGELGLQPDGAAPRTDRRDIPALPLAPPPGPAWRRRDFWCIAIAVAATFAINQATLISLVPYATDRAFSLPQAQWLVSFLAGCSIVGKLALGAAADRIDKRWLLLAVIAAVAVEQAALLLQPGYGTLLLVCGLAGFASGGTLPIWAALVAERFGPGSMGTVLGLMNPVNVVISLAAIRFVGRAYDVGGSYDLAFQVFLVATAAAAVVAVLIPKPAAASGPVQPSAGQVSKA